MLPRGALAVAVQELPRQPRQGLAFRLILARYASSALSSIGSLRSGGRYNVRGSFEALYLASSPVTALLEIDALVRTTDGLHGVKGPPRILLSVEYELNAVVDLTEPDNQHLLDTDTAELCAPWRPLNAAGMQAPTQVLGSIVHDLSSIEALRVPSARDPSTDNLVILPDRLQSTSTVRVFDDSGLIDARLP